MGKQDFNHPPVLNPWFQGGELDAQLNPIPEERAFEILDERGEIVFLIHADEPEVIKRMNRFISIDRKTKEGFIAYANIVGFRSFLSLKIPYTIIENMSRKKSGQNDLTFPGQWDSYPSYNQYISFMEEIAGDYPGITRLDTIGETVEGRKILVMKITSNPGIREAEPAFVYSSSMHGDETCGYILMLRLIDYICSNYGKDAGISRLVDKLEIWINPLANPDGTYWEGDSLITFPKRFNSNNADLNRNFPGIINGKHPDNMEYQPENLAQMNFLKNIYMVMGANFHGGKEVVNYPFDAWETLHADNEWYINISREYAEEAQSRSYPVLYMTDLNDGITNGWDWYYADGTRQDWVNYYYNAREVTIELSLDKYPPAEDLPFFWHYNYPSLLRYMEQSLFGIHGMIRDQSTGLPLKANLHVRNHDTLHSDIFSDSLTGFFARPLADGTYDLEISAEGYRTEVINTVELVTEQKEWLEVNLIPLKTSAESFMEMDQLPRAYFSSTDLIITANTTGMHRIMLYDMKGSLLIDGLNFMTAGGESSFSVESLQLEQGIYLLKTVSSEGTHTHKIFKSGKK